MCFMKEHKLFFIISWIIVVIGFWFYGMSERGAGAYNPIVILCLWIAVLGLSIAYDIKDEK